MYFPLVIQGFVFFRLASAVFEKVADKLKKFITAHIFKPPYVFPSGYSGIRFFQISIRSF